MEEPTPDQTLSTKEAAQLLGCEEPNIFYHAKVGNLDFIPEKNNYGTNYKIIANAKLEKLMNKSCKKVIVVKRGDAWTYRRDAMGWFCRSSINRELNLI